MIEFDSFLDLIHELVELLLALNQEPKGQARVQFAHMDRPSCVLSAVEVAAVRFVMAFRVHLGAHKVRIEKDQPVGLVSLLPSFSFHSSWLLHVTHEVICEPGLASDQTDKTVKFHIALYHREVILVYVLYSEAVADNYEYAVFPDKFVFTNRLETELVLALGKQRTLNTLLVDLGWRDVTIVKDADLELRLWVVLLQKTLENVACSVDSVPLTRVNRVVFQTDISYVLD